jgi:hypothetical protein
MEIIAELEPTRRGVYGGAVGYFAYGGNMDFCITIRTMQIQGGRIFLQVGAASSPIPTRRRSTERRSARPRDGPGRPPRRDRIRTLKEKDMILMIDNYDSFTYNLVQYLGQLGEEVVVRRNDEVTLDEIEAMARGDLPLPRPCSPEQAGITVEAIRAFHRKVP